MAKRSTASATISFGMVAIPVKFYLTASADNVSFNMLTKDKHRVKQQLIDSETGAVVERADTLKGYEHIKGQYVVFTPDELKLLGEEDGGTMDIVEFIPASELNPLHVEKTHYLDADKGGDKAYRLFAAAMKKFKKIAVAQWTSRGRQHLVLLSVNADGVLIANQMYYANEVRSFELDCATYTPRDVELDLAGKLMEALSNDEFEHSKYTNRYTERVKLAVEKKLAGGNVADVVSEHNAAPVADVFLALQKSLEAQAKAKKGAKPKSKKGAA